MKEGEMVVPHLFRCPISLDLFQDPVTLSTGQTYDRSNIEKWLAAGNQTCPVTMQKLHDPTMVPNHNLRHLIDEWLQRKEGFEPSFNQKASYAALKGNLQSHNSTIEAKIEALETIKGMSSETIVQLGIFQLLLEIVFGTTCQENVMFVEAALACAVKLLQFGNMGPLDILKEDSKLECFLVLFDQKSVSIKISLCQLVEAISSSSMTQELCSILGNNRDLLRRLMNLLHYNSEASEAGIRAISALFNSLDSSKREDLVQLGLVDGLVKCIWRAERSSLRLAALALGVLEVVLGHESAKEAVKSHPVGVNALVKMVFWISDNEGSESAVNLLLILCSQSVEAREKAISGGVLTQVLLLLQSQCSDGTKIKARMLLKLLRSV